MASTVEAVSAAAAAAAAAEAATEDDLNENCGAATTAVLLAASPSTILNARNAARYSRGNPCFAKPVQVRWLQELIAERL